MNIIDKSTRFGNAVNMVSVHASLSNVYPSFTEAVVIVLALYITYFLY